MLVLQGEKTANWVWSTDKNSEQNDGELDRVLDYMSLDMSTATAPVDFQDPINAAILAVSEDQLQGFQRDPIGAISKQSGVPAETVLERIKAMLTAGTIRRVRQRRGHPDRPDRAVVDPPWCSPIAPGRRSSGRHRDGRG